MVFSQWKTEKVSGGFIKIEKVCDLIELGLCRFEGIIGFVGHYRTFLIQEDSLRKELKKGRDGRKTTPIYQICTAQTIYNICANITTKLDLDDYRRTPDVR